MRKPPYLSSKKCNKKFNKNVKKFVNFTYPSNGQKFYGISYEQANSVLQAGLINKWVLIVGLYTFLKEAIENFIVQFTSKIRELTLGSQEIATADLESRIGNLEETLKAYVEKIKALELEVFEQSERIKKLSDEHIASNGGPVMSDSQIQKPVPPPPPPPLPPGGVLGVQNLLGTEKPSTLTNKAQLQLMRPTISLEDIINVKLKHTPCIQRTDRLTRMSSSPNGLPRISLEAIRSVKLKKTSLLKETSPSKSSKGKIRHVLRRLCVTPNFGGTPKGERKCQQDDMTPVMTRVLLKRFNAFQMSPDEENKENDTQFL